MKCRMCGFEFDENEIENRGCSSCGKVTVTVTIALIVALQTHQN